MNNSWEKWTGSTWCAGFRYHQWARQPVRWANEEIAADYLMEASYPKKIITYTAGRNSPDNKKIGHAGAIVPNGVGTAESKIIALEKAGVIVVERMDEIFNHLA